MKRIFPDRGTNGAALASGSACDAFAAGSQMEKVVPVPGLDSTVTVPWCLRTIE